MASTQDLLFSFLSRTVSAGGALMTAGVAADPVTVTGSRYHTVIVSTLAGSDVLQIEGKHAEMAGWVDIGAPLNADGATSFEGLYDQIRVSRDSGTGTTTTVTLKSRF